jgi:hypothetical protein
MVNMLSGGTVMNHRRTRKTIGLGSGLLASICLVLLSACSTPAPPTPTPPPAPPPIGLSSTIIELAAGYVAHAERVQGLSSAFADGGEVARDLRLASAYKVSDLEAGAIGYGAVVALQDRAFVTAIGAYAQDPVRRQGLAAGIYANPNIVSGIAGANHAAGQVIAALDAQGQAILTNGAAIKQSAYTIQHQAWSKSMVDSRPQRLADIKALGEKAPMADQAGISRLQQVSTGSLNEPLVTPAALATSGGAATPLVTRALALAALAVLDEVREGHDDQALALMSDPATHRCLTMAKLNLYQCLAVAGPHYEDVFCMGQHAIKDTGQCLIEAAGAPIDPAILAARAIQVAANRDAAMKLQTLAQAKTARAKPSNARKRGR